MTKSQDPRWSLEINPIWSFNMEFPTISIKHAHILLLSVQLNMLYHFQFSTFQITNICLLQVFFIKLITNLLTFTEVTHRFSQCCGKNIAIKNNGCTAGRIRGFDHGLVFSADPLRPDELFEVLT